MVVARMVDLGTPIEMVAQIRKCVCHYPWLFNSDRPGLVYSTFVNMNTKMKQLDKQGLEQEMRSSKKDSNLYDQKGKALSNGLKTVLFMAPQQLQTLKQFAYAPDSVHKSALTWQMCTRELLRLHHDLNVSHLNRGQYWAIPGPSGAIAEGAEGADCVKTRRLACHDL